MMWPLRTTIAVHRRASATAAATLSTSPPLSAKSTKGDGGGDNSVEDNQQRNRRVTVRLVSINDVYDLRNLPRLATLVSSLTSPRPSAICLAGDFISPSTLSSIDGGYGHVSSIRAAGVTHLCLGNHEADVQLDTLRKRIGELTRRKSATVLNANIPNGLGRHTVPHGVVSSECGTVRIGLTGLLSDEHGIFRDGTFRGLSIDNVHDGYDAVASRLSAAATGVNGDRDDVSAGGGVDLVVPLTHQSLARDVELARHVLKRGRAERRDHGGGLNGNGTVILGGHDHVQMLERVTLPDDDDDNDDGRRAVTIVKSGQDAECAAVVDLVFDVAVATGARPRLNDVGVQFVELTEEESTVQSCPVVSRIVSKHLSVVHEMEESVVVDAHALFLEHFAVTGSDAVDALNGDDAASHHHHQPLSSKRTRFRQTTVGAFFCEAVKSELGADVCIINGAPIKGSAVYPDGTMTYGQLKRELPFPLKMVVVPMTRKRLEESIEYSRTQIEGGKEEKTKKMKTTSKEKDTEEGKAGLAGSSISGVKGGGGEIERRGYLQTDFVYARRTGDGNNVVGECDDDVLLVALPRNLMGGFCGIQPLVDLGKELKAAGQYPNKDDYQKAIDLVVRFCCKGRWAAAAERYAFRDIDLNNDGKLDRDEVQILMEKILGEDPGPFLVDDMMKSLDADLDGFIDEGEFEQLLAAVKRRR